MAKDLTSPALTNRDWIACSERMPKPLEDVLAVWWQKGRNIAFWDDRAETSGGWWYFGQRGLERAFIAPTHWWPLPDAPDLGAKS